MGILLSLLLFATEIHKELPPKNEEPKPVPVVTQQIQQPRREPLPVIRVPSTITAKYPSAKGLQCVVYVRQITGIQIYGNANTWVSQARKKGFQIGNQPRIGAVLSEPHLSRAGHVSVVVGIHNGSFTVKEANYIPGFITLRTVKLTGKQQFIYPK